MGSFINFNGKILDVADPVIRSADHSYRYGDGLFETMKIADGRILYQPYHFERLFTGLRALRFDIPRLFTEQKTADWILDLCKKNQCEGSARARLSVSRGSGGLYDCDDHFSWLIECWPLRISGLNENGLIIDVFPEARKAVDAFSTLKSANYLPYVMGAVWAKENQLNDALILNSHNRICDATIANVFWVKDGKIFTPPLSEGCVAGVMRRRILALEIRDFGFQVAEWILTDKTLLEADEVFLTNVTSGIRWVKQFRNKTYSNSIVSKVFTAAEQTKWQ